MINLIDVISSVDQKGNPVGHGLKTIRDFSKLLKESVRVEAGKEYVEAMGKEGDVLPFKLQSGNNRWAKVKVFVNYLYSVLTTHGDILVYTNTCSTLLYGIALFKGGKKIVLITFDNWDWHNKCCRTNYLQNILIQRGLKRLDGCIVTNQSYIPPTRYIRISDYYITDEMFSLQKKTKKLGCVCLGEMRYGKDVAGLAKVMRKTKFPLLIAGAFNSKELYLSTKRFASDNIEIKNENLKYEEYLQYLSSYKYVVLPYDANYYDGRTSGVLLEGIFVGAIPIAPKRLLEQNRIEGLGYNKISEIPDLIVACEQGKIVIKNDLTRYRYEFVEKRVVNFINCIRRNG